MSEKNCPYPGLRPFTADESFYFKGRDVNVRQIIDKLETNKILIITGASGDGKSSLVYAGVIPYARAGFFKARYNRWVFSDFRPERTPLTNFSKSLSECLDIDYDKTEQELNYGFSALVDLYTESKFYIDENTDEWKNLPDKEQKMKRLHGANLFILVDQFEEFFTNSENFYNGKASAQAYTTVNILLETARIALSENLPIYIICTLRSDFISQCIAFHGLPEAIGFSQFFVPKLNRNELQQVIEEPAVLLGGKVTKRLKEILINDLHSGFDQLPILQHTLKQLWKIAENGKCDIDLAHLAKIGGISGKQLPDEDKSEFNEWFEQIDETTKKFHDTPSSSNVLNAHANYLYENAYIYFMKKAIWAKKSISEEEAKLIIKISFQCFTKIDQGRAVRNRATLLDIVRIIDKPNIKTDTVCGVLNIFRLPDSTFLRPFIVPGDIDSEYLSYNTVMDITHEALIRNWEYLKTWNKEEDYNLSVFNEFKVQLQRWIDNDKSDNYLLPPGPLSHFQKWYNNSNPNKYWIAKYDDETSSKGQKLEKASNTVKNSQTFLSGSRIYLQKQQEARQRRRNMVLIAAAAVICVLMGFTYWAFREKAYAQKQERFAHRQADSARFQKDRAVKANLIADNERKIAKKNEKFALISKSQSDSARNLAEKMRKLAEDNSILANTEAKNALREKNRADEQRKNAEQQRIRAELASDSARTLTYLSLSQSISLKAIQRYSDPQLNLILAAQAYKFNIEFGGYKREPAVYDALRYALSLTNENDKIPVNSQVSSFNTGKEKISVLCRNGLLYKYSTSTGELLANTIFLKKKIPVNSSYFVSPSFVVVCYEDKQAELFNTQTNTSVEFSGHKDYIRAACLNNKNDILVTASRDKTIIFWKLTSPGIQKEKVLSLTDRVTSLVMQENPLAIIAGTDRGRIIKASLYDSKPQLIYTSNLSIRTMNISNNNELLAVGYSDGTVNLIEIRGGNLIETLSASISGIRSTCFDNKSELLAVASNNKTIKLYDLQNITKNPIVINDFREKILSISFLNNTLYALTDANHILYWQNNCSDYAKRVNRLINRDFTDKEWRVYIGDNIPHILNN